MAVFEKVGGFSRNFFQINCRKNEESISPLAEWDGNIGLLALMQIDNSVVMVTKRGSSLKSSKDFKSIYSWLQILCHNLMDTAAPNGMPSFKSSECVDVFAGSLKNNWSRMAPMPDVLDPAGWSDDSDGGCSCANRGSSCWGLLADGGFWDVGFKMAAANLS